MKRSSRAVAGSSGRAVPGASAGESRASRRTSAEGGARKRTRGSGRELVICFGVIGFLGVVALLLSVQRSGEKRRADEVLADQERAFKANMELGFARLQRAETTGLLFVKGKDGSATPDKLFGSFRNDDKVYNVIYDRHYKEERVPLKTEQKALYPERLRIEKMDGVSKEDAGVRCCYGFAENRSVPLVVATKSIKADEGDTANLGGMITVMVRAENERRFDNARQPKSEPDR